MAMPFHLFHLEPESGRSLQSQLHAQLTAAIMNGNIPLDMSLPSSRKLASVLGISRNTVIRVYERMLSDGIILSRERSGYYVNPEYQNQAVPAPCTAPGDEHHLTRECVGREPAGGLRQVVLLRHGTWNSRFLTPTGPPRSESGMFLPGSA